MFSRALFSHHSSSSSAKMTASVTPDGYLITVSMIDLLFRNSDRGKAICDSNAAQSGHGSLKFSGFVGPNHFEKLLF